MLNVCKSSTVKTGQLGKISAVHTMCTDLEVTRTRPCSADILKDETGLSFNSTLHVGGTCLVFSSVLRFLSSNFKIKKKNCSSCVIRFIFAY